MRPCRAVTGRRQQLGMLHHGDVEAGRGELVMMPLFIWLLLVIFVAAYAVALSRRAMR